MFFNKLSRQTLTVIRLEQFLFITFTIYTDGTVEWNNDTWAVVQV